MEKTCSRCGKTKPLSEFHKNKNAKDGYNYICKECACARARNWRAANRQRAAAGNRAWREANPERHAATDRAWYIANKERHAATDRAWREANPERQAATSRAWYIANKERQAATGRAWREANPERRWASSLRWRYGISPADYAEMLETQENGCAICGKTAEEDGQRLAVDHDHDTGEVRGLLCGSCNPGIGFFQHDRDLLHSAIAYLEQWAE